MLVVVHQQKQIWQIRTVLSNLLHKKFIMKPLTAQ